MLATLLKSITKIQNQGYEPAAIALHPNDFELVQMQLSDDARGRVQRVCRMSQPRDACSGYRWHCLSRLPAGVGWTFATGAVALNVDSGGVNVQWSETSNADDFAKNLIRARCEGRYATSVYSPLGVVNSDLSA